MLLHAKVQGAVERDRSAEYLPQNNSVPVGTAQQMKMSRAAFKATTENLPMAPFAKGGGPKDRSIFASNRHFPKRRKDRKGQKIKKIICQKFFLSLAELGAFAPWRDNFLHPTLINFLINVNRDGVTAPT